MQQSHPADLPMQPQQLPTVFRGYHKIQVITYIDMLNAMIVAVENGCMSGENALQEAEKIMKKPLAKAFGGFAVKETEEYLSSLMAKLRSFI
ncbi:MAG: hypothetical protein E7504_00265 [Ruminococcus sp.]|nr:hypothetical protein [Ruminococcus sp.]